MDDNDTGFIDKINIFLYNDKTFYSTTAMSNVESVCKKSALLPSTTGLPIGSTSIISVDKKIYKDNKERLDITFQIEPIATEADKNNIVFGELLGGLSNLVANKNGKQTKISNLHNLFLKDIIKPCV